MTSQPDFDEYKNKISQYIGKENVARALNAYIEMIDESVTSGEGGDIVMEGNKGQYELENLYLIEKMLEGAESTVRLYIDDINDSAYGDFVARNLLMKWLDADVDRTAKLLVHQDKNFKGSNFFHVTREFIESKRLDVRKLDSFTDSVAYADIYDHMAVRLALKADGSDCNLMTGNFFAEETAQKMLVSFDDAFKESSPIDTSIFSSLKSFFNFRREVPEKRKLRDVFNRGISTAIHNAKKNPMVMLGKEIPAYHI